MVSQHSYTALITTAMYLTLATAAVATMVRDATYTFEGPGNFCVLCGRESKCYTPGCTGAVSTKIWCAGR